MHKWLVSTLIGLLVMTCASAETCSEQAEGNSLVIDLKHIKRTVKPIDIPRSIYGFSIPWLDFQYGYVNDKGQLRPEIVSWLRPFRGAILRYPGGTESNWFEWRKSVGPMVNRLPMHFTKERIETTRFGLDEYLDLVNKIEAVPLIVANLAGPFGTSTWTNVELHRESEEFATYLRSHLPKNKQLKCSATKRQCDSLVVELGNELDWPPFKWSPEHYSNRAAIVASAFRSVLPSVPIIGHMTSSPWGKAEQVKSALSAGYTEMVPRALSHVLDGYSFHPYYDGISVPDMNGHLDYLGTAYRKAVPAGSFNLYITEHGRWPNEVLGEDWRKRWHLTGDLSGALSTSDFLMSLMHRKEIKGAAVHALGAYGPWQIFRKSRATGNLYPNAVYWALRTMREATFETLVAHGTVVGGKPIYAKNYDARYAVTADAEWRNIGVLVVNRSGLPLQLTLQGTRGISSGKTMISRVVTAPVGNEDQNTDSNQSAVIMAVKNLGRSSLSSDSQSFCIPGRSTSTYTFAQQQSEKENK